MILGYYRGFDLLQFGVLRGEFSFSQVHVSLKTLDEFVQLPQGLLEIPLLLGLGLLENQGCQDL